MSKLTVQIGASIGGFLDGLNRAGSKVSKFAGDIRNKLGSAAGTIGISIGVASAVAAVKQIVNNLDNMEEAAGKAGFDASEIESWQKLTHAANQAGSSAEGVGTAFKNINTLLSDAAAGSASAAEKLGKVGLTIDDLKGKTQSQKFDLFADALLAIGDPAERAARACDLFGRAGKDLLPMLESYKAAGQELEDMGGIISAEDISAAGALNDKMDNLGKTIQAGVVNSGLIDWLAEVADNMNELVALQSKLDKSGAVNVKASYTNPNTSGVMETIMESGFMRTALGQKDGYWRNSALGGGPGPDFELAAPTKEEIIADKTTKKKRRNDEKAAVEKRERVKQETATAGIDKSLAEVDKLIAEADKINSEKLSKASGEKVISTIINPYEKLGKANKVDVPTAPDEKLNKDVTTTVDSTEKLGKTETVEVPIVPDEKRGKEIATTVDSTEKLGKTETVEVPARVNEAREKDIITNVSTSEKLGKVESVDVPAAVDEKREKSITTDVDEKLGSVTSEVPEVKDETVTRTLTVETQEKAVPAAPGAPKAISPAVDVSAAKSPVNAPKNSLWFEDGNTIDEHKEQVLELRKKLAVTVNTDEQGKLKEQIKDKLATIKELVDKEAEKLEFKTELKMRVLEMRQEIEVQKLRNSGKDREAFVQEQVNQSQNEAKSKGRTISDSDLEAIKQASTEKYNVEHMMDGRNFAERMDMPADQFQRMGIEVGNASVTTNDSDRQMAADVKAIAKVAPGIISELGRVRDALDNLDTGRTW